MGVRGGRGERGKGVMDEGSRDGKGKGKGV